MRERGVPAPREQVMWALRRTKGNEYLAVEMIAAQPKARRALAALRDPSLIE